MFHSFQSCLFLFRLIPPASTKQQPITRMILEYQRKGSNRKYSSHFKLTIQPLSWPCPCAPHRLPSGRLQHGSPGLLSGSWISQWTCKIHFRYFFSMIVHTSISPKEWVSCALYACGSPQQGSSGRQDLPSPSGESPRCPPGPFSRIFKNQDPVESNNQP